MSTWRSGDVRIETGGASIVVVGNGVLAERLRMVAHGGAVWVAPPPGGSVPLRADSDWLVDRWIRQWAGVLEAGTVTSDYEPSDEDIPADVRELEAERIDEDEEADDRVY